MISGHRLRPVRGLHDPRIPEPPRHDRGSVVISRNLVPYVVVDRVWDDTRQRWVYALGADLDAPAIAYRDETEITCTR